MLKIFRYNKLLTNNELKISRCFSAQVYEKIPGKQKNEIPVDMQHSWSLAKPFEELPALSKFKSVRMFLPGGKLYKKSFDALSTFLNDEYGDIVKVPGLFGRSDMIFAFNPEDFETVYRNEGIWPDRPGLDAVAYYRRVLRKDVFENAEGLLVSYGEEWGRFRSIANPILMQPKTIKMYVPRMNTVASDFVEKIRSSLDPTSLEVPEKFNDQITNWTLESICLVALDTKLNLIKDPSKHPDALKLKTSIDLFFEMMFRIEFEPSMWKYVATPTYKRFIEAMDGMTEISMKYVEQALKKVNENVTDDRDISERSILERLSKIDKKFGLTMAMDLLTAGVDTTASAFVGCLTCLAKNPEKQEILRKEILKVLPNKDSPLTNENMKNLPYLRACIKEALRVYPVTVGNVRAIARDIVIGGYRIPKNTRIIMPALLLYKDDAHYSDSEKFIPERWLRANQPESAECPFSGGKGKSSNPFTYIPFGFGPRMCIGKRLVDLELEIGLAKIIRNFLVEFNYPVDNLFRMNIINVPNIPLKYKFIDI